MSNPTAEEEGRPLNTPDSSRKPLPAVSNTPPLPSSARHRPAYARIPSISFMDERLIGLASTTADENDITRAPRTATPSQGLGIDGIVSPGKAQKTDNFSIRRVPVSGRNTPEQQTPDSSRPLMSPASSGRLSGSTRFDSTFGDFDTSYHGSKHMAKHSSLSLQSTNAPSMYQGSEQHLLRKSATASIREQFDKFAPRHICTSSRHFKRGLDNWLAITIVLLSIFSTFFSGAFLIIAFAVPKYAGRTIGPKGGLTVSNAAFFTSIFAKLIELSFVTVVVAFLGQALARRLYRKDNQAGVTLAEMRMRSWITQPGTLFIQWQTVKYAGISVLGILALLSAIMAMLYTSAATALVQPQLKFSGWKKRVLQSEVSTSFANSNYLRENCKTPITSLIDGKPEVIGQTCISIEHASQAYHNYERWISIWTDAAFAGNTTGNFSARLPGWALLHDNTTVTAPWIEQQEPFLYGPDGWFINNVTMAMPHPGVVTAAIDPANHIMQPDELNGLGIYSIRAQVPVPFVNVICAMGISKESLKPLVYREWEDVESRFDTDAWPSQLSENKKYQSDVYLNGTPFDDIFRWGPKWGANNAPPIFPKMPKNYNSLVNDTTNLAWGRVSLYVLGKGGPVDAIGTHTDTNYALCELRVGQTVDCSTQYNASSNVGTLEAICEDPDDDMRYVKSLGKDLTTVKHGNNSISPDWPNIASMWASSVNLNDGVLDGDSANIRLWSQFILTNASIDWATGKPSLADALPSPAEALAVMSGCTLLQSAQDGPFVDFWNYSVTSLTDSQTQYFNASVRAQQYGSGGTQPYQKVFYIVLFSVFIINVVVLAYWLLRREWYNDFSDPANLFSLAINSPPSEKLAECSCGGSPDKGGQFKHYWKLGSDGGHVYMESPEIKNGEEEESPRLKRRTFSEKFEEVRRPLSTAANRWSRLSS